MSNYGGRDAECDKHFFPTDKIDIFERELISSLWPTEIRRYRVIKSTLMHWKNLFAGKNVLDFGCGYGLSVSALLFNGAKYVVGIEPDEERVKIGSRMLHNSGLGSFARIHHIVDTSVLPFKNNCFDFILANGVLEHIPIPRKKFLCEIWRLVVPEGYFMINETPNKYFPKDIHTTDLWFNHWLPETLAYRRAIRLKRYSNGYENWKSSGWRGLGFFEISTSISGYQLVPEYSRLRHRILYYMGIPPSIFDPYPIWIFKRKDD